MITNKDLLYSTWKSVQWYVAALRGGELGENRYISVYGWILLLFIWNYCNIVNWLYLNKEIKVKRINNNFKKEFEKDLHKSFVCWVDFACEAIWYWILFVESFFLSYRFFLWSNCFFLAHFDGLHISRNFSVCLTLINFLAYNCSFIVVVIVI